MSSSLPISCPSSSAQKLVVVLGKLFISFPPLASSPGYKKTYRLPSCLAESTIPLCTPGVALPAFTIRLPLPPQCSTSPRQGELGDPNME